MSKHQQSLFDTPGEPAPWERDDAGEHEVATIYFSEAPGGPFDYLVPSELTGRVEPGRRVRVPLGRGNRTVTGYCVRLQRYAGQPQRRLKAVQAVLDAQALLGSSMLKLTEWMSDYYLCPWGQVLEGVVPAGVREQAGTRKTTVLDVPRDVVLRMKQLELPAKQADALRILAASEVPLTPSQLARAAGCGSGPIKALRQKKLVRERVMRVQHTAVDEQSESRQQAHELNAEQRRALDVVLAELQARRHHTVLLRGVTGSGKTEIYIRAIERVIELGRQAIVLVPEISLTPQTRQRFRSRFDRVAVLHSHLSDAERHWHWQRIARGEIQVVVGARSAVFAPTPRLGLIVLDEEHDSSFKQDSSPRYHAREVALQRAKLEDAPLVLGSATPSLESWQRARQGVYRLVELSNRVLDRPLPDVAAIDLRDEYRERRGRGAISRPLHQAIMRSLDADGQVILLLNRRGFSTSIQCPACGHLVRCPDCDIALTHHRESEKAVCHYCDYTILAPTQCPECSFEGIRYSGLGTQRLEAEVRARFKDVPVLRMDSDTMQKPGSHEKALARFRSGEIKILLGTQMIAKGLDFPNVTLVGVINADTALHFPDFRAAERTFQLVTQVAGRTGRGAKGGRVLVQTSSPEHPALQAAMRHDYVMFADQELPAREEYGYPPYSTMVRLIVRGAREELTQQFVEHSVEQLEQAIESESLDVRVLGPAPAPISKLRGKFRFHALLQSPRGAVLRNVVRRVSATWSPPEDVQWVVDVDPLDML